MSHRNPSQLRPVVASAEPEFSPVMDTASMPMQTFEIEVEGYGGRSNEARPLSRPASDDAVNIPSATQVTVAAPADATQGHVFVAMAHPVMPSQQVVSDATSVPRREQRRNSCLRMACILAGVVIMISVYFIIMAGVSSDDDDRYDDEYDDDYYNTPDDDDYTPDPHYYSSGGNADAYLTVTSPVEGDSYVHGDKVPVTWESSGLTQNSDDGETYVDVYYCTSYDASTSCYGNSDCTYLGRWYDSYKSGTIRFQYTVGTLYVCLEDDFYTSPFGYSGAFTMSASRRLSAPKPSEDQLKVENKLDEQQATKSLTTFSSSVSKVPRRRGKHRRIVRGR